MEVEVATTLLLRQEVEVSREYLNGDSNCDRSADMSARLVWPSQVEQGRGQEEGRSQLPQFAPISESLGSGAGLHVRHRDL